jgi:3-deoxy-D-arabino-heptulosonate 7-phosphate (DAHP) synthase
LLGTARAVESRGRRQLCAVRGNKVGIKNKTTKQELITDATISATNEKTAR